MAKRALNSLALKGRLLLTVHAPTGEPVAERRATNMVLRGGAARVAALLAGQADVQPINAIGVGFAVEPGGVDLAALTPPPADSGIDAAALRTALTPDAFTIDTAQTRFIQLRVTARFSPTVELPTVSEAGLLSGDTLYNQVIFEPVTLAPGQDVSFFWQIDFPYGR